MTCPRPAAQKAGPCPDIKTLVLSLTICISRDHTEQLRGPFHFHNSASMSIEKEEEKNKDPTNYHEG